jgi:hypothetical protein
MRRSVCFGLLAGALLAVGCPIDLIEEGGSCEITADCAEGLICLESAGGKSCQDKAAPGDAGIIDGGSASDAGEPEDASALPDAGAAPDAGILVDGGLDGGPSDAGHADGGASAFPDCSDPSTFTTQIFVSSFDNGILSEPGASDLPGDAWTQHEGTSGMRRQNDVLNIGGPADPLSASTPHRALDFGGASPGGSTWLLRVLIEPAYPGTTDGHVLRFLMQSASGDSPALGFGLELSAKNSGAFRVLNRAADGGVNAVIAEKLLASALQPLTVYRLELCFSEVGAVGRLFDHEVDAGPMSVLEIPENLIPELAASPLMRIEAEAQYATPMTKVDHIEILRTP